MKNLKTTILTTTALLLSASLATAESPDGFGSSGVNNLDFRKLVAAITQERVCEDLVLKDQISQSLDSAAKATKTPPSEMMVLASRRASDIIERWSSVNKEAPDINYICNWDLDNLSRFGSFAHTRVSNSIRDRIETNAEAFKLRELTIKYQALKKAGRSDCLNEDQAYKADFVADNLRNEIKRVGHDAHTIIYKSFTPESLDAVKAERYPDQSTCELAVNLITSKR